MADEIKPTFVITVPHAKCHPHIRDHLCDFASLPAAIVSQKSLKQNALVIAPIIGDINRFDVDLNRIESRETEFRHRILQEIETAKVTGHPVFVVDVHSFNRGADWGTDHDDDLVLVLLDGRKRYNISGIPEMLKELLGDDLTDLISTGGSHLNDIVATAQDAGALGSILIEFSEYHIATNKRMLTELTQQSAKVLIETYLLMA